MECQSKSTAPRRPWLTFSSFATRSEWTWHWEALKLYKTRKKFDLGELLKYAKICRVEKW